MTAAAAPSSGGGDGDGGGGGIQGTLPSGFASNAVFERMSANMAANPKVLKKVNGVLAFKVSGGPGKASAAWTVDARVSGGGKVSATEPADGIKADVTISIADSDLVSLASGKLNPMSAYMSGKLKLSGNKALAQKLGGLLGGGKPRAKL